MTYRVEEHLKNVPPSPLGIDTGSSGQDRHGRHPQDLSGCATRPPHHAQGPVQRGSALFSEALGVAALCRTDHS